MQPDKEASNHNYALTSDAIPEPPLRTIPEKLHAKDMMVGDLLAATDNLESLSISPRKISKELADHSEEPAVVTSKVAEDLKEIQNCNNDHANEVLISTHSKTGMKIARGIASGPLRPALKSGASKSPKLVKSVIINPEATIFPTRYTPLENVPHHEYTTAEKRHKRSSYNRSSRLYKSSTWASPDGYEKINTSHFRTNWAMYCRMHRVMDRLEAKSSSMSKTAREDSIQSAVEHGFKPRRQKHKGTCKSNSSTAKQPLSGFYYSGPPINAPRGIPKTTKSESVEGELQEGESLEDI